MVARAAARRVQARANREWLTADRFVTVLGHFAFAHTQPFGFLTAVMDATKVLGKALVASPERRLEADADLEVVRQVQAGDVAAFDRLISKYRERVFGIVYNMTSNREDAADLTQDAFIKAFQSIQRFGGQSSSARQSRKNAAPSPRPSAFRTFPSGPSTGGWSSSTCSWRARSPS